jgi:hypothetical protein
MIMGADPTTRGLLVVNFFQLFVGGGLKAPPPFFEDTQGFLGTRDIEYLQRMGYLSIH